MQCGRDLERYEPDRYARCGSCFKELSHSRDALSLPADAIARVTYFPGFAEDLTTWNTTFYNDGTVTQLIHWYPPVHGEKRRPELHAQLDVANLSLINETLSSIELTSLAQFKHWMCVDDAPFVHIFSPRHNLHVSVDQCGLDDDEMPEVAKAGVDQFQTAWKLLDSLSPYTVDEHYR